MKYILAAIVAAGWLYMSADELATQMEIQREHEARITDVCAVRGFVPVRDQDGRLVCPDSGPKWAMANPLEMPK